MLAGSITLIQEHKLSNQIFHHIMCRINNKGKGDSTLLENND